ncbi:disease resistance-like protein DSC2 [Brassica napus]|uniref:disease resistance protein TAO1-like n=1 Tax=Brassica oleracea var. oleracea TaxID=109376 RepID=UPI0006A6B432|nr:PREDICTED: disease resistance protein TAO1-like [Brassica oleracea var. oleracea]XP_048614555.1 disease resistance-like protein DSC2 [Brassica napus]XP_048614556.1 disease resistance-like protein DSC2 [Brassica napus]
MALSALSRQCKHHVFPSFHGPDVRRGFLSYLLKEFKEKGIDVFIDNDIERSKLIGPELTEAIRGSLIALVLITRNYASSAWCLNELVQIMKCWEEDKQTVQVIFYEVDPSDVKNQKGDFGAVFHKTCAEKSTDEVERWRQALQIVAQIAGYHTSNYDDDVVMIETIVTDISNKFNDSTTSNDSNSLVGIGTHIKEIESLLSFESDEVRMVGIWGPAGIGKTTIARALFREFSSKFTHAAFIESIKGKFEQNYRDKHAFMLHLQEQLLSETLNQKDLKIGHLGVAKARLKDKKVLVVLDDVDDLKQLEAMTDKTCWFGPQSRIIITTKDKKLLVAHEINHIYQVGFPSTSEALEILCLSAFRQNSPSIGFEDMAIEVTRLAGHLPLGLRVFGAYLRGVSRDQWIHALPSLRMSLDGEIEKVLRFSYDALSEEVQELFLHIACFFKGGHINDVVECLADGLLNVNHGLQMLVDKCFISLQERRWLVVHNLLEKLAKEIVRKQSVSDPGKRQFLVDAQDICDVLEENAGTKSVRGIDFDLSEVREDLIIDEQAFKGMSRLQFLRFRRGSVYENTKLLLPQGLKFRASKLRFLEWDQFPLTCFPREFQPRCLVKLVMRHSKLEKLWEGPIPLPCLKLMDLTHSFYLKELPDLSNVTNLEALNACFCSTMSKISFIGKSTSLEELHLAGCSKLIVIPSSIGNAINFMTLNDCRALVQLPSSIWSLKKLKKLGIAGCAKLNHFGSQLRSFPDVSGNITEFDISDTAMEEFPSSIMAFSCLRKLSTEIAGNLKVFPDVPDTIEVLQLHHTGIEEIPPSIQNLSRLTELSMPLCKKLKVLPTNVNLQSLSRLDLSSCTQLRTFPEISTSIRYLDLSNTAIEEVPSSVWSWSHLLELNLEDCRSFRVLHSFPDNIEELDLDLSNTVSGGDLRINLKGCKNLVSLPNIPYFVSLLDASNCESLVRIDGFFTNPERRLSFANCFKLSEAARELIEESDYKFALLPGGELPADFDHRAREGLLTVNLDQSPLPLFFRFRACLLLPGHYIENKHPFGYTFGHDKDDKWMGSKRLSCDIWCVQNGVDIGHGSCKYRLTASFISLRSKEHLYFLKSSISLNLPETDVNFSELHFEFKISGKNVKDFAVQLLEDPGVHDEVRMHGDVELVPSHVPDSAGGRVRHVYSFKRQRLE